MRDFYARYYEAMLTSRAHAAFCEQVFGRNLCQHGFADMAQLDALIDTAGLGPGQAALDLGCGNGMIAEYLSDQTGAQITGLDYIPAAIRQARERTAGKHDRLAFRVGDITALELPNAAYDVIISIDTIYFSSDYPATIRTLARALRAGGRMAFLYSYGREPWVSAEEFRADTLEPDQTPLAVALQAGGLRFEARDLTAEEHRLAILRKQSLLSLRSQFEAEGIMFIYENRMGDANGISQAIEMGLHRRYLYLARQAG